MAARHRLQAHPGHAWVQFTPPGSQASIQFGQGATTMKPGSLQDMFLIIEDIEAARDELIGRGVEVSEIWHIEPSKGRVPGLDPQRRSYSSRASFADPDGNTWVLQEITERLPGRVEERDSGTLAQLLLETALRHASFEPVAPPHDWWEWYGATWTPASRAAPPMRLPRLPGATWPTSSTSSSHPLDALAGR